MLTLSYFISYHVFGGLTTVVRLFFSFDTFGKKDVCSSFQVIFKEASSSLPCRPHKNAPILLKIRRRDKSGEKFLPSLKLKKEPNKSSFFLAVEANPV